MDQLICNKCLSEFYDHNYFKRDKSIDKLSLNVSEESLKTNDSNTISQAKDISTDHLVISYINYFYSRVSDPRLLKLKLNLNFVQFLRFQLMVKVVKELSNNDCNNISEKDWNYLITERMSQIGYKNAGEGYWKYYFNKLMDLYITTIERSTNYDNCLAVFPFIDDFNSMALDRNIDNYNRIITLRENITKGKLNSMNTKSKLKPNNSGCHPIIDYLLSIYSNLRTNNQKSNESLREMTAIQTKTMTETENINKDTKQNKTLARNKNNTKVAKELPNYDKLVVSPRNKSMDKTTKTIAEKMSQSFN